MLLATKNLQSGIQEQILATFKFVFFFAYQVVFYGLARTDYVTVSFFRVQAHTLTEYATASPFSSSSHCHRLIM